jgi:hypothetical protein
MIALKRRTGDKDKKEAVGVHVVIQMACALAGTERA